MKTTHKSFAYRMGQVIGILGIALVVLVLLALITGMTSLLIGWWS